VIKGTGFEEGSTVTIGKAATEVKIESETEIKAKTASATAAGKDKVVVTLPDGVASESKVEYTYVAGPTVTSISPTEGSTEGETAVRIKGTGFMKHSTVKIGSTAVAAYIVVSSTEIVAETAPASAGKDKVIVDDSFGMAEGPAEYTYVTPPAEEDAMQSAAAPASLALPPVVSPAPTPSLTSTRKALQITATVSGRLVLVHLTPAARRAGRVLVTLRLVHGKHLLATLTHTVTVTDNQSLTFTLRLPAAARHAATELRAGAAYAGSTSGASPTVTVALARTSRKPR
jgi:IPT/TIG domain